MKNYLKYSIIIVLVLIGISGEAQSLEDAIGFDEGVNDTKAAPIHFLIPLAMTIGAVLGIKNLNNR